MKKGIHKEFKDTKFICACGETFTLKSNKDEIPQHQHIVQLRCGTVQTLGHSYLGKHQFFPGPDQPELPVQVLPVQGG